jgi:hypothetical protein
VRSCILALKALVYATSFKLSSLFYDRTTVPRSLGQCGGVLNHLGLLGAGSLGWDGLALIVLAKAGTFNLAIKTTSNQGALLKQLDI